MELQPKQFKITKLLPTNFNHKVVFESLLSDDKFCSIVRVALHSKEEVATWLEEFMIVSATMYRVDRTYKENAAKLVFKKEYRPKSHHAKIPHKKNTFCNAKLTIKIKQSNMKRSKDPYLKDFPCEIYIRHNHNHNIICADALKHRNPSNDVREIFEELYCKGHSPSTALEMYKSDLQIRYHENYNEIVADGFVRPTRKWCYDLYYAIFNKEYGDATGSQMIIALKNFIDKYNRESNDICAALSDEDDIVIAICSPLMKRIHENLKSSCEVLFIDSSGNMDRHNSCVFILLCASAAGGLPLGIFITYLECESTISKRLALLKTLFPEKAFYGCGSPCIIISDDSQAERNALKFSFPNAKLLLCQFHVLPAVMRFLWDSKQRINKDDRVYIYKLFQKLVNTVEHNNFDAYFEEFLKNNIISKYTHITKYFRHLYRRSEEWALCFRQNLLTRGNNTNNYCEAGFRLLKDKILHRTKAFSVVQLFDFLTTNYIQYYVRKLTDILNNRYNSKNKYDIPLRKIKDLECTKLPDGDLFKVVSTSRATEHIVNMYIETCTCFIGLQGAFCKHQYAVITKFNLHSNILFLDAAAKNVLHNVVTGKQNVFPEWYEPLQGNRAVEFAESNKTDDSNGEFAGKEVLRDTLKAVFDKLSQALDDKPDVFCPALSKFSESFNKIKTESALISALNSFKPYSGAGLPMKSRLCGGQTIGVQPTAVMRRKMRTGGRHNTHAGRPCTPRGINDHTYVEIKRRQSWDLPISRKMKAPYSLSFCVDNNISLGKTH